MQFNMTSTALFLAGFATAAAGAERLQRLEVFLPVAEDGGVHVLRIDRAALTQARANQGKFIVERFAVTADQTYDLELERFRVTTPDTRVVLGRRDGIDVTIDFDFEQLTFLRGRVVGSPGSDVFLALSDKLSTGHVTPAAGGPVYQVSHKDHQDRSLLPGLISVFRRGTGGGAYPDVPLCGMTHEHVVAVSRSGQTQTLPDTRQIEIAYETDREYFDLFGNIEGATLYTTAMTAAVSNIYIRDVNTRVNMAFLRLWDTEDDPYDQTDPLGFFRTNWNDTMTGVVRDTAHLLSGRRDFPYGGIAYLNALCSSVGYGVNGYLNGEFPSPSSGGSYDVAVVAHELGHNCGTLHTPDYNPPIDRCFPPPVVYQRSTLMSYCSQTTSGGNYVTDLRFHARVQTVMENFIFGSFCIASDCNGNTFDDADDVALGTSQDINSNGIPDECEDCNDNSTLDPADIAGGTSDDVNGNGVPDECEADCNGNSVPDTHDIALGTSTDAYGDNIPDSCEADCDNNGTSDYTQLLADMTLDINRDLVLDQCEDCDGNGTVDAVELAAAHNVWIGSYALNVVGQYHARTGVLVRNSTPGFISQAQDVLATGDGRVLVSSANDDRVAVFDDVTGTFLGDLMPAGSGGLDHPTGMVIKEPNSLLVASRNTNSVLEYDLVSGAFLGEFVAEISGGLTQPFGLTFGPNGNLFVTSNDNRVIEYDGTNGSLVGSFVSIGGNGGLSTPRSLLFKPDGNLLVAGFTSDNIHEYDGTTGLYQGVFQNGGTLYGPWGMRIGPNGNVFVTRDYEQSRAGEHCPNCLHVTTTRLYEYDARTGNSLGSFVVGDDTGLFSPTGFDFVPGWTIDCNNNLLPDSCDIAAGADQNSNGTVDSCEVDCNNNGQQDFLDIVPFGTSIDCNDNGIPDECDIDCNNNGVADECDIADGTSIDDDSDGIPDECEAVTPLPAGPPHDVEKNRYISFFANNPDTNVALTVLLPDGRSGWIDAPQIVDWNGVDTAPVSLVVDAPVFRVWEEPTIHVTGCVIVPAETYRIRATVDGVNFSTPLVVETVPTPTVGSWADIVGGFDEGTQTWSPSNGFVNFNDIDAGIKKFQTSLTAPHVSVVDLHPQWPNYFVNFADIDMIIKGFQGAFYPVPVDDCEDVDNCPLSSEAPCLP